MRWWLALVVVLAACSNTNDRVETSPTAPSTTASAPTTTSQAPPSSTTAAPAQPSTDVFDPECGGDPLFAFDIIGDEEPEVFYDEAVSGTTGFMTARYPDCAQVPILGMLIESSIEYQNRSIVCAAGDCSSHIRCVDADTPAIEVTLVTPREPNATTMRVDSITYDAAFGDLVAPTDQVVITMERHDLPAELAEGVHISDCMALSPEAPPSDRSATVSQAMTRASRQRHATRASSSQQLSSMGFRRSKRSSTCLATRHDTFAS